MQLIINTGINEKQEVRGTYIFAVLTEHDLLIIDGL
jgi:hypothetical protein